MSQKHKGSEPRISRLNAVLMLVSVAAYVSAGELVQWGISSGGVLNFKPTDSGYVQVAAGAGHSVALRADGSIVDWGNNDYGQLNNTPAGAGFVQVAAGMSHSLGLKEDGSIVQWGDAGYGQLLKFPLNNTGFVQVSAAEGHSLALRSNGTIVAWGLNVFGQLSNTPTDGDYIQVVAGMSHNLALKADGTIVQWWGGPPPPSGLGFVQIAAGPRHCVALRADGTVVDWGSNTFGALNGTPTDDGYVQVAAGQDFSVALKADGSLVFWGNNSYGQQNNVPTGAGYVQVSTSGSFGVALTGPSGGWTVMRLHPPGAGSSGASSVQLGWEAGVVDGHAGYWTGGDPNSWVDVHPAGYATSYTGKIGGGQIPGYAQVVSGIGNYTYHAGFWNIQLNDWTDLHPTGSYMSMAYSSDGNYQAGWAGFGAYQHAMLWHGSSTSYVDLNPAGALASAAYGSSPGVQVGYARFFTGSSTTLHAGMWAGTASSWVDLHPDGAWASVLQAENNGKQVGHVNFPQGGPPHASVWSGNKASWVDLHPPGAAYSNAVAILGNLQVGAVGENGIERAALWQRTASSFLSLHELLPPDLGAVSSSATGIQLQGLYTHISGTAYNSVLGRNEAVLWLHKGYDFTPPETNLVGNFDGFTNALVSGSSTISGNLFLSVSGSDDVSVAEFEYSLDGGPYTHCGASVFLSSLALGTHTVNFRSVDSGGNADLTPASFSWTVITASAAVQDMQAYVQSLSLSPILEAHLLQPLNNAWNNLNDGNPNNDNAVKAQMIALRARVSVARSQGKLTAQEAQLLIDQANAVIASLGP